MPQTAIGAWMKFNSRSIYACGAAPEGWEVPADCRYTFNEKTKRLYLHLFAWPFKHVHLPGLKDRIGYAQFLHDASEIRIHAPKDQSNTTGRVEEGALVLELPTRKPAVEIPVIELSLK